GDDNDQVFAGSGPATLLGGKGNDLLVGSPVADMIFGGDGDDWLIGRGGNDAIDGGTGIDQVTWPIIQPTAYWSFNDVTGNVVVPDSAGTPQNGTAFSMSSSDFRDAGPPASIAPFGAGTAAEFGGDWRDYIAVADNAVFDIANGTVQFWFNPSDNRADEVLF